MKKSISILLFSICLQICVVCVCVWPLISCQYCTRKVGGTTEITLEPGEKLVEVTWKTNNLWILTEPMDSDYVPKTKTFKESSLFGVMEGTVIIHEQK